MIPEQINKRQYSKAVAVVFLIIFIVMPGVAYSVTTVSGTIGTNTTWTLANSPYYVEGDITVSTGITLIIEPGVIVKFATGTALNVSSGTLNAQGTAGNEIYFTDYRDDSIGGDTNGDGGQTSPVAGGWNAIYSTTAGGTITLNYCVIKYSGNATSGLGAVRKTYAGTLTVTNSTISDSGMYGVHIASSATSPHTLSNITITNNGTHGIYLANAGNGTISGNNVITNNAGYGIYIVGSLYPAMSGTYTFSGNTSGYMGFAANASFAAASYDSLFPGQPVFLATGSITVSGTWSSSRVYYPKGNITVNSGVTLAIDPGVKIKLTSGKYINVSGGTLNAQGTVGNPIYITDYRDDSVGGDTNEDGGATTPAAGGWSEIYSATSGSAITLNYCVIKYGGSSGGAVRISETGNLTLANSTVSNSGTAGVYITSPAASVNISSNTITNNATAGISLAGAGSGVTVSRNTITNNNTGIYCSSDSNPVIGGSAANGNDIYGNTAYGVRNISPAITVNATHNYWGDPTGPYHATQNPSGLGNSVSDYVDYNNYFGISVLSGLPEIQVSISSIDFGGVNVGASSQSQTVTISNKGPEQLFMNTINITGTDAAQFSTQNDNCTNHFILSFSSCTVDVLFSPTSGSTKTADLNILTDDPDSPTLVPLVGTGVCTDGDLDGYFQQGLGCGAVDCDDTNDAINPGVAEIWYDNTDQNCDGWNDYDQDMDTYVASSYPNREGGTSPNTGDCDDTSSAINPGSQEILCDNTDQNCNGMSDDDKNSDNDPANYCSGDCNDNDPVIYPNAPEACDGKDNDCNGQIDDYVPTPTSCGVGVCASNGQMICVNMQLIDTCVPGTPAADDATCDGLDDDCDGQADEDYVPIPSSCGVGTCTSTGQLTCSSGEHVDTCVRGTPSPEVPGGIPDFCEDGLDNDCDGVTDASDGGCMSILSETYRFERLWPALQQPWYFRAPGDIAVDADGFVYVVEINSHRVQKLTADGHNVTAWGSRGNVAGQFYSPRSIAVDNEGFVYVLEQSGRRVQKFSSDGGPVLMWGSSGSGNNQFNSPEGIAVDNNGFVYIADTMNHRISKWTTSGQPQGTFGSLGSGNNQFNEPRGIAVDNNGIVYVADTKNHRISKWTTDGQPLGTFGSSGPGNNQFNQPKGIDVDNNGSVYVADTYNWRISRWTTDGQPQETWNNGIGVNPLGISLDKNGVIYVCYGAVNRGVQKFTTAGQLLTEWKSHGSADGQFIGPNGIAIDSSNSVLVVDSENWRVQVFDLNGVYADLWGSHGSGAGQFQLPKNITIDSDGFIYVTDWAISRIQKFNPDGDYLATWTGINRPTGIAADSSGNVYVLSESLNNVNKILPDGTVALSWGSECRIETLYSCVDPDGAGPLEIGDGEFNTPQGVAVDGSGFVYVADSSNSRIQKFTSNGEFVLKWGSSCTITSGSGCIDPDGNGPMETGDGQFSYPSGIAIDSSGFVYVTDRNNQRIQKFTPDGHFITKLGGFGSAPDKFLLPISLAVADNGRVFVSDGTMNNVKVFKKVAFSSRNKAIVVAGGGPYAGNKLWEATQTAANFAYWTLMHQGFPSSSIYYLTANANTDLDSDGIPDRDGDATIANLQAAIETWAADPDNLAENLFVYLVDHGGSTTFRMSETETLSASQLDTWLDAVQCSSGPGCLTGNVTVIYDACESGSFLSALTPPLDKERILITSTSSGESSYFVNQGSVSFSNFFWTNVFNGSNVKEAFDDAKSALTTAIDNQTPLLEDGNSGTLAQNTYIGNGTIIYGNLPTIESVSATVPTQSSATLTANNVTDTDGIARVWAVILPPNYTSGASNNSVNGLPYIDLMPTATPGQYQATYDKFNIQDTYKIAVYAKDSIGNTSMPKTTKANGDPFTVFVDNPLRRRAIIVAAGTWNDLPPNWAGIKKGAQAAYNALKYQGYSDNDIYFMNPEVTTTGWDAGSSVSNLSYAINTWATNSNIYDLVLYMVGNSDSEAFQISSTETLSATQLDGWLDTLQGTITGKVTVVYDASLSGGFITLLAPPADKERILISSTGSSGSACFLSEGDISFSRYFWIRILNGANVRDAFFHAQDAMSVTCEQQVGQLSDDGDGVTNEQGDGVKAFNYVLGAGIKLAGNDPMIGEVVDNQDISGTDLPVTIWAKKVTTTGDIQEVWAVITPPGYSTVLPDQPVTDLTKVPLIWNEANQRYEGTSSDFPEFGRYKVAIYAKDNDGNISMVEEKTFTRIGLADSYEEDDDFGNANVIVTNAGSAQQHNFYDGDDDWVKFYGVNGVSYEFKATNVGAMNDVAIKLYRSDGTTLVAQWNNPGTGVSESHSWICDQDEVFYVKVYESSSPQKAGADTEYDLEVNDTIGGGGWLTGEVKKSLTEVLNNATVRTYSGSTLVRQTSTASNGVYIITSHPVGSYTVKITYSGYQDYNDSFNLPYDNYTITRNATMTPSCMDGDGDGYGNPGSSSCPNGSASDCNDGNASIKPGAAEVCDGTDNDCDAYIDEGFTDTDSDGVKNCVDSDDDNDGVSDASDVCPLAKPAKIGGVYYNTLQQAYDAAADGATVWSQNATLTGSLNINANKTVTITGGYDCGYANITGTTTVSGSMTISNGKVMITTGTLKVQ